MKKRAIPLLLVVVLAVTCLSLVSANAAAVTQQSAVTSLLKWAKFTQTDADTVGGWVDLAYYVDLVLETDTFDRDAPCPSTYYNTLRKRANELYRQNSVSKIPVYPFVKISQQPEDLFPDRDGAAVLSVNAAPIDDGVLSYQWYRCDDENKTNASLITGATSATYTAPTDMYGDYYYFCRITTQDAKTADSCVACVDVPVMKYDEAGLAQQIFTYTDASVQTYTNKGSDIVRFCVYVETDYDTDSDGKLDLIKAVVQVPRAAIEGEYDAAVIYEARPYCAGTTTNRTSSGSYDISKLYSTADPREYVDTITAEEMEEWADAAKASDFYFYENLDWYDYFLVRGYAVVLAAGPGTRGSEGFETCGSDLEIDAFACVIEWLTGDRVAYTDKTNNIAIEADWCNGQVGMTGRSYAGTTQFGLATTGVKGLETIVPVAGIASWYEYSCAQGLYLRSDGYTDYLAAYCASRFLDKTDWATISAAYTSYLGQLDKDEEALFGSYGPESGHWGIRDYTRNADKINCSALIVHGLNDSNVITKHSYMMYESFLKAGKANDVKVILHQDGHVTPAYGAAKTEQLIDGESYHDVLNRWFTYYLYDIENGANNMAPVTAQSNVDGSKWDTYNSWGANNTWSESFTPNATISNYSGSSITVNNCLDEYTKNNTAYSQVTYFAVNKDTTINGVIEVKVTATPQTTGNNQMLTAWLVDMSDTAFNAFNVTSLSYDANIHETTGQTVVVGGGAENYKVVELEATSVKAKIIASGHIDLANPEAGFYSNTATNNGNTIKEEQTYTIYLDPTVYTVKGGHKLALVICTRDPFASGYTNINKYSVLISNVEVSISVY